MKIINVDANACWGMTNEQREKLVVTAHYGRILIEMESKDGERHRFDVSGDAAGQFAAWLQFSLMDARDDREAGTP